MFETVRESGLINFRLIFLTVSTYGQKAKHSRVVDSWIFDLERSESDTASSEVEGKKDVSGVSPMMSCDHTCCNRCRGASRQKRFWNCLGNAQESFCEHLGKHAEDDQEILQYDMIYAQISTNHIHVWAMEIFGKKLITKYQLIIHRVLGHFWKGKTLWNNLFLS